MHNHKKMLTISIIILALLSSSWLLLFNFSRINQQKQLTFRVGIVHEQQNYTQKQQFSFNYQLAKKLKVPQKKTVIITGSASTLKKQFKQHQLQLILGLASKQPTTNKINYLFLPNTLVVNRNHPIKDLTTYHHKLGIANSVLPTNLTILNLKQKKYSSDLKLLNAINKSQIHAGIMSNLEYNYLTKQQPEFLNTTETRTAFPPMTASVTGALVEKKYHSTIKRMFKKMQLDGQLANLSVKYFFQDYTQE